MQGANQLLGAAQSLGAVLFASTEYTSLGTDNPAYITDLYEGYLQRAPDPAGHANWLAVLNGGASRATLRNAFASSPEFQNKATSVCVNPGGSSSGTRYLISDTRGSTRAVMNNSGVGTSSVVARHDYLPFGEELWSGTGMRVAGQGYGIADGLRQKFGLMERDAASGLDNTWWRKYDSSSGRWTSPDPATASMTATDPQSFNRYSYVQNDPVNLIDPTGLFWIIDLGSCRTVAWVTTGLDTHHQQTFEIQVCGLIWFPDFAPEPQGPRGGGRRPQRRQPRQHPPCPVQPLDPITDQQAQNFEAGNNVDVMGLTAGTQNALLCFEGTIRGGGGTTQLGSAYRPEAYQRHLRDVWDKWGQLQRTNNPNCAGLRQQVQAEMNRHQITERPCLNGANCPHVEGRAFDMSVTLGPGQNRQAIMRQCGVSRPRPTADGGHHYEATNP
jgi:RHS repeat-associated protein